MIKYLKGILKYFLRLQDEDIVPFRTHELPQDITDNERDILRHAAPFTMTSIDRQLTLCRIIDHILQNKIPGDFVECGVWRGGSSMIAAMKFKEHESNRKLWLYDTYEGMPPPDDSADISYDGQKASATLLNEEPIKQSSLVWAIGSLKEVEKNLFSTQYPQENILLIKGEVEKTIPGDHMPTLISVLRLDTDWYSSTLHELMHLYPLVVQGGFIIIDDYGHWRGAKTAVDEYLRDIHPKPYLHRIDYTCRVIQKL